jgi:hypothetical protein
MKATRARYIETEGHGQAVPSWPTTQAPTLSSRPVQRPKLHYFVQVLSHDLVGLSQQTSEKSASTTRGFVEAANQFTKSLRFPGSTTVP